MNFYYTLLAVFISCTAVFAYVNHRFAKLPNAIALMLAAMVASLLLIAGQRVFPGSYNLANLPFSGIDFSGILMGSLLSFLLFAGSLQIRLDLLKKERLPVLVFSTVSVILSTAMIGCAMYFLLLVLGVAMPFMVCLLFGALISPTDPLAVLAILKKAGMPASLEMQLSGESLFNDGIAIVVFLSIYGAAKGTGDISWPMALLLFVRQTIGGIALGVLLGYSAMRIIRGLRNLKVEILITLALVTGGYSVASALGVSGPLAMIVAGILFGNFRLSSGHHVPGQDLVILFWEIVDDILNSLLFVAMGMQLLYIRFNSVFVIAGTVAIGIVLLSRYLSLLIPYGILGWHKRFKHNTLLILTWGGLRGGLSFALALSLPANLGHSLWVTTTYMIVTFAILVQGLTVGKLAAGALNSRK